MIVERRRLLGWSALLPLASCVRLSVGSSLGTFPSPFYRDLELRSALDGIEGVEFGGFSGTSGIQANDEPPSAELVRVYELDSASDAAGALDRIELLLLQRILEQGGEVSATRLDGDPGLPKLRIEYRVGDLRGVLRAEFASDRGAEPERLELILLETGAA